MPLAAFKTEGIKVTVTRAVLTEGVDQTEDAPLRALFFCELAQAGFVFMSLAIDGSFHLVIVPPKMPLIVAGLNERVVPLISSRRYAIAIDPATYGTYTQSKAAACVADTAESEPPKSVRPPLKSDFPFDEPPPGLA